MPKKIKVIISGIILATLMTSCATTGKSIGTGALMGAASGATSGAIACPGPNNEDRTKNILIGTGSGIAVGILTSLIIHDVVKKKEQRAFELGKQRATLEALDSNTKLFPETYKNMEPEVIYSNPEQAAQ